MQSTEERQEHARALLQRIRDALGTSETGDNLVSVARDAHRAEIALAARELAADAGLDVGEGAADVGCFLVIVPNYWGKGESIPDAMANCMKAGYVGHKGDIARVYAFDKAPSLIRAAGSVGVDMTWPKGTTVMRWDTPVRFVSKR